MRRIVRREVRQDKVQIKKNEIVRKILQICASCDHSKMKGRGLICNHYPGQCHSKRVKHWVKEIEKLEVS